MSRMPVQNFIYFRRAFPAYFFIAVAAIFTLFSPSAYADPHAVFYTDRAQEQLFYNTLAALNQADYVEPATGDFSREILLDNRESATKQNLQPVTDPTIFGQEQNPLITSTRTELPAALTRSITLEGNDLWTAYLVNQFALETDVRRSASKLLREDFCTNGLGVVGCDTRPGPSQRQSTTFPTDINSYRQQPNFASASGLTGGTQEELNAQDELTGTGIGSPSQQIGTSGASQQGPPTEPSIPESLKFPRASFPEVIALRENNKNNSDALRIVNETTASVISSQYNSGLDSNALNKINFLNNGKDIKVADNITFDEYINTVRGIGSLVPGSLDIAEQGRAQGEAFQKYREQTPSLAQYTLTKEEGGGVKGTITVPSTAISSQIQEGVALLANATIGQKTAASTEDETPGLTPALSRAQVAGISTENSSSDSKKTGEVAGIMSFANEIYELYDKYYNKPLATTNNPQTGLIPFSDETGPREFKQIIGGKNADIDQSAQAECGFCTSLGAILNSSTQVSAYAETIYTDLYCFFYPTTEYCAKQKP